MYERLQRATHIGGLVAGSSLATKVSVSASTTTGVIAYMKNPLQVPVIATLAYIHIATPSTVACDIDLGTAATNVASDNQIDGAGVNMPVNTVYDNITDHGTNGTTRNYVPVGGFFTASVGGGDANGLVADFQWDIMPIRGGQSGLAEMGNTPG